MNPETDIALTRLKKSLREMFEETRLEALKADAFTFDDTETGDLPSFIFKTSKGLVRWSPPNWEAVMSMAHALLQYRMDQDKALKDPMREFNQSIAENKPKRGRSGKAVRP